MLTLCDNPQETLTSNLWEKWKTAGYIEQQNALTWLEVNNLAKFYLRLCKQTGADYRDFDFETIIDHKLNYYENVSMLENAVGQPQETRECEALAELNGKLESDYGITVTKNLKPSVQLETENKQLKQQLREAQQKNKDTPKLPSFPPTPIMPTLEPAIYSKEELVEILDFLVKCNMQTQKRGWLHFKR